MKSWRANYMATLSYVLLEQCVWERQSFRIIHLLAVTSCTVSDPARCVWLGRICWRRRTGLHRYREMWWTPGCSSRYQAAWSWSHDNEQVRCCLAASFRHFSLHRTATQYAENWNDTEKCIGGFNGSDRFKGRSGPLIVRHVPPK